MVASWLRAVRLLRLASVFRRREQPVGVKYTHEDVANSIMRQVELDKRRSPFGKLIPFPPRGDSIYEPLDASPRNSWETELRGRAIEWAGYWGMRFSYLGILLVCALAIISAVHGGPTARNVVLIVFGAAIVLCVVKISVWVGRANTKAMGLAWRARMTREAEERLARDDPGRDW